MSEEIGRLVVKFYRSNNKDAFSGLWFLPPPPSLKKGHIVLHLLDGRSVDQAMSAQYA